MKYALFICTLSLAALLLCACNKNENSKPPSEINSSPAHTTSTRPMLANSAIINDSISLEESLSTAYAISDLNAFFEPYHKLSNPKQLLTFHEVNNAFPVEIIRPTNNYSVYNVQEGGLFYVFWSFPLEEQSVYTYSQSSFQNRYVASYVYIPKTSITRDISSIQVGKSSALDLLEIDPFLEIIPASQIFSFTYLSPDELLRVSYSRNEPSPYLVAEELIVNDITVVPRTGQTSHLQLIQAFDLP